jgi:hypothetical protein
VFQKEDKDLTIAIQQIGLHRNHPVSTSNKKKKKNKVANPNFTVIIPLAICSNLVTDLDHFEALPAHQTDPQIFKPGL